jgi:hypothetical protein
MDVAVTFNTQRSQILFYIIAQMTSEDDMVNFQSEHRTAILTAPAVTL